MERSYRLVVVFSHQYLLFVESLSSAPTRVNVWCHLQHQICVNPRPLACEDAPMLLREVVVVVSSHQYLLFVESLSSNYQLEYLNSLSL